MKGILTLSPLMRLLLMLLMHTGFWLLDLPLLACFLPLLLLPREEIKLERAYFPPKNALLTLALFPFTLTAVMGSSLLLGGGEPLFVESGFWPFWMEHALLAALTEEIFFRGALLPLLIRFDKGRALILSSLLFALFHPSLPLDMADTSAFVAALIGGFFLGGTVLLSGSLLPAILLHLLNNTLSSVCLFYPSASLPLLLSLSGLSLLTVGLLLWKRPRPTPLFFPFWQKLEGGMVGFEEPFNEALEEKPEETPHE